MVWARWNGIFFLGQKEIWAPFLLLRLTDRRTVEFQADNRTSTLLRLFLDEASAEKWVKTRTHS